MRPSVVRRHVYVGESSVVRSLLTALLSLCTPDVCNMMISPTVRDISCRHIQDVYLYCSKTIVHKISIVPTCIN